MHRNIFVPFSVPLLFHLYFCSIFCIKKSATNADHLHPFFDACASIYLFKYLCFIPVYDSMLLFWRTCQVFTLIFNKKFTFGLLFLAFIACLSISLHIFYLLIIKKNYKRKKAPRERCEKNSKGQYSPKISKRLPKEPLCIDLITIYFDDFTTICCLISSICCAVCITTIRCNTCIHFMSRTIIWKSTSIDCCTSIIST